MITLWSELDINMGIIYGIIENGQVIYVGQTIKTLNERWKEHKLLAKADQGYKIHEHMHNCAVDDKFSNFSICILENTDHLNEREEYWISYYNTLYKNGKGYNMTKGGQNAPETLKHICYQYNRDGTFIQAYESISEASRSVMGDSTGESNIQKVLSNEINMAYGYRWSDIYYDRLQPILNNYTEAKKEIYQYNLDGSFVKKYDSVKEAARQLKKSQGNISSAATGKRKTAYGFIWSYDYIMERAGY